MILEAVQRANVRGEGKGTTRRAESIVAATHTYRSRHDVGTHSPSWHVNIQHNGRQERMDAWKHGQGISDGGSSKGLGKGYLSR